MPQVAVCSLCPAEDKFAVPFPMDRPGTALMVEHLFSKHQRIAEIKDVQRVRLSSEPVQYRGLPEAVLMAAGHLDPEEGPMRIGHAVDSTDLGALRTVLRFLAQIQNG